MNKNLFKDIYKDIEAMPVFSDHDHHQPDAFFENGLTLDQALARSYVQWTGYVADGSLESRKTLLENVKYNTFFVWYQKGLQKVYGIDEDISLDNWDTISEKMQKRYIDDPDFHWKSLLDNGYNRLILDAYWDP